MVTKMETSTNKSNARPVLCLETMTVYSSIADASKRLNISAQNISHTCQNKMRTAGGFHWQYVEPVTSKPITPVMCVETGEVFPSVAVAAREKGLGATSILKCIRGQSITAGGYHWVYQYTSKNGETYIGQTGGKR